jgi:hypothetical protein
MTLPDIPDDRRDGRRENRDGIIPPVSRGKGPSGVPGEDAVDDSNRSEEGKIKVVDRRLFTADGARRQAEDGVSPEPELEAEPPADLGRPDAAPPESGFDHRPVEEPEGVDFTLLINAMAQPVVILLDEVPQDDPRENQARLEQARLQIDFLDLLRVKCRGNLTREEEKLLDQVLYQLRMLFVQKSRSSG